MYRSISLYFFILHFFSNLRTRSSKSFDDNQRVIFIFFTRKALERKKSYNCNTCISAFATLWSNKNETRAIVCKQQTVPRCSLFIGGRIHNRKKVCRSFSNREGTVSGLGQSDYRSGERGGDPVQVSPVQSFGLTINSGCGKREAHINWSMVTCKMAALVWNYIKDYWPCAGAESRQ